MRALMIFSAGGVLGAIIVACTTLDLPQGTGPVGAGPFADHGSASTRPPPVPTPVLIPNSAPPKITVEYYTPVDLDLVQPAAPLADAAPNVSIVTIETALAGPKPPPALAIPVPTLRPSARRIETVQSPVTSPSALPEALPDLGPSELAAMESRWKPIRAPQRPVIADASVIADSEVAPQAAPVTLEAPQPVRQVQIAQPANPPRGTMNPIYSEPVYGEYWGGDLPSAQPAAIAPSTQIATLAPQPVAPPIATAPDFAPLYQGAPEAVLPVPATSQTIEHDAAEPMATLPGNILKQLPLGPASYGAAF